MPATPRPWPWRCTGASGRLGPLEAQLEGLVARTLGCRAYDVYVMAAMAAMALSSLDFADLLGVSNMFITCSICFYYCGHLGMLVSGWERETLLKLKLETICDMCGLWWLTCAQKRCWGICLEVEAHVAHGHGFINSNSRSSHNI